MTDNEAIFESLEANLQFSIAECEKLVGKVVNAYKRLNGAQAICMSTLSEIDGIKDELAKAQKIRSSIFADRNKMFDELYGKVEL